MPSDSHGVSFFAQQGPSSHVAVSLYQLMDGFLVLEKKLREDPQTGQPLRTQPLLTELRYRMDKFVKKLGGQEPQVRTSFVYIEAVWGKYRG